MADEKFSGRNVEIALGLSFEKSGIYTRFNEAKGQTFRDSNVVSRDTLVYSKSIGGEGTNEYRRTRASERSECRCVCAAS